MKVAATRFMARPSRHLGCISPAEVSGFMTVPAMSRCNSRNSRTVWRLSGGLVFKVFNVSIRFESLVVDFIEGWNARVPLQQGGRFAGAGDGVGVKFPDRIDHRVVVR